MVLPVFLHARQSAGSAFGSPVVGGVLAVVGFVLGVRGFVIPRSKNSRPLFSLVGFVANWVPLCLLVYIALVAFLSVSF